MSEHGEQLRPLVDANFPAKPESPKPEVDTQTTKVPPSNRFTEGGEGNLGTGKRFMDGRKRVKN